MPYRKNLGRRRKNDVVSMLIEQLEKLLGETCAVTLRREKPWASITFSGTRHYIEIRINARTDEPAIIELISALPDHEFDLPGYFVADTLVHEHETGSQEFHVEILTIIDPVIAED